MELGLPTRAPTRCGLCDWDSWFGGTGALRSRVVKDRGTGASLPAEPCCDTVQLKTLGSYTASLGLHFPCLEKEDHPR